ncbi:MAG: TatD family hydrolase [Desulfobacteraceae bacterium]|nr:TatD family hydrolase [Desulfobacteraceae bacterium]
MQNPPELIDSHAHLDFPEFIDSIPATLDRARDSGVRTIITIGIDLPTSRIAADLAQRYDSIYATAGIHPHDAFIADGPALKELELIARGDRVVGIGEIGLDYFRNQKPRIIQQECLRQQLALACRIDKPAVFHIREAWEDFFGIIPEFVSSLPPSVMHCFSGDWEIARKCLDLGLYLSIPGVVTFPKADALQEVASRAPLDRLLVETDAPYLAPVPHRGKDNEPAFAAHTARKIAELRGIPLSELAEATTRNTRRVFRIKDAG